MMQRAEVVFLTTGLAYGGAETQLVRVVTALRQRGYDIQVVSMLPPQAFVDDLKGAGIPLTSLNMRRGVADPRALLRLCRLLRESKPRILACFMYHANLMGRIAGRIVGISAVVSSVRTENFGGWFRERLLRLSDRLGDITVANSRLVASALVRRGIVPADGVITIPNGLDMDLFTSDDTPQYDLRQNIGVSPDRFLWLSVGRLEEPKDYPNLLEAFRTLLERQADAELRVVGQGSLQEMLQKQALRLGISEHVVFMGLRRDIPSLLHAADAYVLSSAWEGLPNAVMEAMAARKPVVATSVGGVSELVQDGITGFIVPSRDATALASAMDRMMSLSQAERDSFGLAGRAHVETHFSLDLVVARWENLFSELLRANIKRRN